MPPCHHSHLPSNPFSPNSSLSKTHSLRKTHLGLKTVLVWSSLRRVKAAAVSSAVDSRLASLATAPYSSTYSFVHQGTSLINGDLQGVNQVVAKDKGHLEKRLESRGLEHSKAISNSVPTRK